LPRLELSLHGYRIPATLFGDGNSCLVCVNAAQQTMGAWGAVVRRFVREGYRVAVFDFPNQGCALATDTTLGLLEQADLTCAVSRELCPNGPVDLIGASWGALVATACAARHPKVARRLLLGGFQARTHPRLQEISQRCVEMIVSGTARDEMADLFISEFGAGLPQVFRDAMRAQFAGVTDEQLQQMYTQTATLAAGADLREIVDLHRITAEILIVNGAEDPLVDVEDYQTMAGCFKQSELHIIEGLGHFLHLERPSLIDLYLNFVRRHSSCASAAVGVPA
jgi:pimeloyl-ACP methyl ester carboxylesterase